MAWPWHWVGVEGGQRLIGLRCLLSTICVHERTSLEFDDNLYYLHSLFILQCLNFRYLCFHGLSRENVGCNDQVYIVGDGTFGSNCIWRIRNRKLISNVLPDNAKSERRACYSGFLTETWSDRNSGLSYTSTALYGILLQSVKKNRQLKKLISEKKFI
jgi:hypothetical protein